MTKSICKRLARKADKSKIRRRATEIKFLKAITRSYVFFFFIGTQKELRITAQCPVENSVLRGGTI
jgi:hypothetical protein